MSEAVMALLLAFSLGGSGDIYRCIGDDGQLHYADRPCPGGGARLGAEEGHADNPEVLRRWLESMQAGEPAPRSRASVTGPTLRRDPSLAIALPPRPSDAAALRACSGQFFACAGEAAMDACIESIPACGRRHGGGCCRSAFLERYRLLRAAGARRAGAVREALLGR